MGEKIKIGSVDFELPFEYADGVVVDANNKCLCCNPTFDQHAFKIAFADALNEYFETGVARVPVARLKKLEALEKFLFNALEEADSTFNFSDDFMEKLRSIYFD